MNSYDKALRKKLREWGMSSWYTGTRAAHNRWLKKKTPLGNTGTTVIYTNYLGHPLAPFNKS